MFRGLFRLCPASHQQQVAKDKAVVNVARQRAVSQSVRLLSGGRRLSACKQGLLAMEPWQARFPPTRLPHGCVSWPTCVITMTPWLSRWKPCHSRWQQRSRPRMHVTSSCSMQHRLRWADSSLIGVLGGFAGGHRSDPCKTESLACLLVTSS